MRMLSVLALLGIQLAAGSTAQAQAIIAQSAGIANPDHVIDFGANVQPNFTAVTTQFPGLTVSHARYYTTTSVNNIVGGFLTNDFSGSPNTFKVKFASPISDLSFVYHQIATNAPSVFRAMLGPVQVASFSNTSDQFQPNNYFGFTNVVFDELQIDFVIDFNVDTLAFNDAAPALSTYCTAGTTSNGCLPAIGGVGAASASAASGFTVSIANVEGQRAGLILYGIDNSSWSPLPWGSGSTSYLCVRPPTQRTAPQSSGGAAGTCTGALTLDWNAFRFANPGALGAPFQAGDTVYAQGWFRDPTAPRSTNLSNGLQFGVGP